MTPLILLAAVSVAAAICIVLFSRVGWLDGAMILTLFAVTVFPRRLLPLSVEDHVGVALTVPAIMTYSLPVVAVLVSAILLRESLAIPRSFALLLVFSLFGLFSFWGPSALHWAGVLQIALAVAAWGAGAVAGRRIGVEGRSARLLARFLLLAVVVELAVCIAQYIGVPLPGEISGVVRQLEDSRVYGTVGHPADLSKIMFLSWMLLFPLTTSPDRRTSRTAVWAVALSLIVILMTVSRANMVAAGTFLLLWMLLSPNSAVSGWKKLGAAVAVSIPVGVFLPLIASRFAEDPDGGARPELLVAGLAQIARNPLFGTGPNSYVEVVSQFDATTALTGYPVHNSFLLMAAELGIPAAILFFLPFVAVVARAIPRAKSTLANGAFARAAICASPGLVLIMVTGWGLTSKFLIIYVFWVFGVISVQIRERASWPDSVGAGGRRVLELEGAVR